MVRTLCSHCWLDDHVSHRVRIREQVTDKGRIIGTTSGALVAGAFSLALGACCVAPWAVSLLGVAGAVALARLSFLQPYMLLATAVLLGLAFWYAYRPVAQCADGTCTVSSRRWMRSVVWLGAAAAAVLVAAGYAARFLT